MTPEQNAVMTVAGLMALAARTAPKGKGTDTIAVTVLAKKELKSYAARLESLGVKRNIGFFIRDARNIAAADACVVIGSRGDTTAGINCGGCGYASCADFEKARKKKVRAGGIPRLTARTVWFGWPISGLRSVPQPRPPRSTMWTTGSCIPAVLRRGTWDWYRRTVPLPTRSRSQPPVKISSSIARARNNTGAIF